MKQISLLYATGVPPEHIPADRRVRQRILADLNLTASGVFAGMDKEKINAAADVMLRFDATGDDIALRAEIISELEKKPALLEALNKHFDSVAELKRTANEQKRLVMRTPESVHGDTAHLNYNHFISACGFLVSIMRNLRNMGININKQKPASKALTELAAYIKELTEESGAAELAEACWLFTRHVNEGVIFDVRARMDQTLHITELDFTDFRYVRPDKSGMLNNIINALTKIDEKTKKTYIEKDFPESVRLAGEDPYLKSLTEAHIKRITKRITLIYEKVIETFLTLADEFSFYAYSAEILGLLKSNGIPFCFARFAGVDEQPKIEGLCDISLALYSNNGAANVVRNDFELSEYNRTSIILGPNSSGKTTFLRALGCALLLARCGMPVPAETAVIEPFSGLYTHFPRYDAAAKNEGQLSVELEEISETVYGIKQSGAEVSGGIVLMNESFSSTGQKDALQISVDVLSALSRVGARVIFVTHIASLPSALEKCDYFTGSLGIYKTTVDNEGNPCYSLSAANRSPAFPR